MRKGLGKGKGRGYKNIAGKDPKVHSQSAKGMKQPQKIPNVIEKSIYADDLKDKIGNWKQELSLKSGTFQFNNEGQFYTSKLGAWKHPNGKWILETEVYNKKTGEREFENLIGSYNSREEAVKESIKFMKKKYEAFPNDYVVTDFNTGREKTGRLSLSEAYKGVADYKKAFPKGNYKIVNLKTREAI